MSLIHAYQGLGKTIDIVIKDASGNTITPGANDKIRAIIGREGNLGTDFDDAAFYVTSDAATDNGSTFTKNSPSSGTNRLRLDASDTALIKPGTYTLFIDYFDNADASEWKNVDRQVFNLELT